MNHLLDRLVDLFLGLYGPMPYTIVFIILFGCGIGLPIPEDIILIGAGVASYYGVANVNLMVLVAILGILVGDCIIFWLGAHYGRKLTKKWFFNRILSPERLEWVKGKFHRWGNRLIFIVRFMPGFRAPAYFSAGTLHLPFRIFIFYDGMAALISAPLIVYTVFFFGDQVDLIVKRIQKVESGILITIIAVAVIIATKFFLSRRKHATR